ncbi:MAG: ribulose 1,5-bisphosphate carboxylase large subunit [Spirochaetales bacterium]|nr:ribulose 1,5-bisphosphate carboxylase large subunit [Spirochaetales bacterium]
MKEPVKDRFTVTYRLFCREGEAEVMAEALCIEQTIEFPLQYVRKENIGREVIGRVESLRKAGRRCYDAVISFLDETAGPDFPQFLNVLFGNSSLKPGIRVERIDLSPHMLGFFKGPRFGIDGLRKRCGAYDRPLLCTAIKPLGLPARELAHRAYRFAYGGIDIIKDDHGLSNQVFAPFKERASRCAEAIHKANARTGGAAIYAPNITSGCDELFERAVFAKRVGAGAFLISPGLAGYDAVKRIASSDDLDLPLIYHPAFQGSFVTNGMSGISPAVLFGELPRLAGSDAAIFPNFGGRFTFSKASCGGVRDGCVRDMTGIRKIFPVPGGGMGLSSLDMMKDFYGTDVAFLIGGDLFAHGNDIVSTCRMFREIVMSV